NWENLCAVSSAEHSAAKPLQKNFERKRPKGRGIQPPEILLRKISIKKIHAFLLMFFSIVILVIVSEMFAGRIEAIAHALNFGELFIGAVLVGVAGNAAEHLGAMQFAIKNKMSLVLNTTIGSSLQIAMFVAPVFVFVSFFMGNFMSLTFLPIEIVSIFAAVLLMNEISRDGCVNWLEGAQLVSLYIIIGVLFFFHV
ncbi:hypothetical protein HZA97_05715, partial [Candidatus Woesearchaeota archaeon]|nr:hypothetical protein [Candidatus Woesearchaeota archaeon]